MKILVCIDGSNASQKAVKKACEIADGCKVTDVTLVHVYDGKVELPVGTFGFGYHPSEEDIKEFKRAHEEAKEKSKECLIEAEKVFNERGIEVNSVLEQGPPAEIVVELAEARGSDLIILGRRGISGPRKLFLGSVSNAVLQQATTSVLIVK